MSNSEGKIRVLRSIIYYQLLNNGRMVLDNLVAHVLGTGVGLEDLNLVTAALNGLQQDGFLEVTCKTNNERLSVDVLITAVSRKA